MIKISLLEYKTSSQYLYLFDAIIKEKIVINRDAFLEILKINPGTYRRAKNSEQKTGVKIVGKLSSYFNLAIVSKEYIHRLESLLNDIIYEVEYKVFEKYDKHLQKLNELLEENLIIFPILKLFIIFLNLFSDKNITITKNDNRSDFLELTKFYNFFNESLKEVYDLIQLVYCDNYDDKLLTKKYENGIGYSIISINYKRKKKYYESLYFANKAKDIFIKENNFKRAIYINNTILNNLVAIGDFEEYYELANKQYLTVRALDMSVRDKINCMKHVLTSCISLRKYNEVKRYCENKTLTTITEIFCYIIAQYYILKEEFSCWIEKFIDEKIKDKNGILFIKQLIEFLKKPEKSKLEIFKGSEILEALLVVLLKVYC